MSVKPPPSSASAMYGNPRKQTAPRPGGAAPRAAGAPRRARRADRIQEIGARERDLNAEEADVEDAGVVAQSQGHGHGQGESRDRDSEDDPRRRLWEITGPQARPGNRESKARPELEVDAITIDEDHPSQATAAGPDQALGEAVRTAGKEAARRGFARHDSATRFMEAVPNDRLGDLTLVDPLEMKRELGPAVRFAQHAMLLAHDRLEKGASRAEALDFLASLYRQVAPAGAEYAARALREFGPATGILDLYPLELMEYLLEHAPELCPKIRWERFIETPAERPLMVESEVPVELSFDPSLRLRGFAIHGGGRPGYLLEPGPQGSATLRIDSPGSFRVLLSALRSDGWLVLDELPSIVHGDAARAERSRPASGTQQPQQAAPDAADGDAPGGPERPEVPRADSIRAMIPRYV